MPLLGSGSQPYWDDDMGPSRAGDRRTKFARAHYSGKITHVGPAALDWNHNSDDRWNPFLATDHKIRRGDPREDTTRVYSNHREKDKDNVYFGQLGDVFLVPTNVHNYGADADGNPQRRLELDIRKMHVYFTDKDHGPLHHVGPDSKPPRGKQQWEVVKYFHRLTGMWRWKAWVNSGGGPPPTPKPPGTPGTPTPPPGPNPGPVPTGPTTPSNPGAPSTPTGGGSTPTGGGTSDDPSDPWGPGWNPYPDGQPYDPGNPGHFHPKGHPWFSPWQPFNPNPQGGGPGAGSGGTGTGSSGGNAPTGGQAGVPTGPGQEPGEPPTFDMQAEAGDSQQQATWAQHSNQHSDDMYVSSRPTGYERSILGGFQMRAGFSLAQARMGRSYLGSPAPTTDPGLLDSQNTDPDWTQTTYEDTTKVTQNQSDGQDAATWRITVANRINALSDYQADQAKLWRSQFVERGTATILAGQRTISVSTTYAWAGSVAPELVVTSVGALYVVSTENHAGAAGSVRTADLRISDLAPSGGVEIGYKWTYTVARSTNLTPNAAA